MLVTSFFDETRGSFLESFHEQIKLALDTHYVERVHGRKEEWDNSFDQFPQLIASKILLNKDTVQAGIFEDLNQNLELKELLLNFHPWRKGPFNLFGTEIDTEWRSDWKWNRLLPHITSLNDRKILDIGCGNGYHLFRMLGAGARVAVGADPTRLFLYQFNLIKKYLGSVSAYLLPLKSEQLPEFKNFDSVFSMGVLYHRKSPLDHLQELHNFLRPGGELILETLVIDEDAKGNEATQKTLVPEERYAKMANVWFIPTTHLLERWLQRTGFTNVRTVDINQTSVEEQRSTQWMTFQSLSDFLDPEDCNKTIEGYPAPKRAIIVADKPNYKPN